VDHGVLEEAVSIEVEKMGFECIKLEVVGLQKSPVVRLYIDKPGGVSIKDCSLVSRAVGLVLDRIDPFPGRYLLEVSSPGSDRPLVKPEHFERFRESTARVTCREEGGKKTYTGLIRSCINGVLTLGTDEGDKTIRLKDMIKANLVGVEYEIDKKTRHAKRSKGGR